MRKLINWKLFFLLLVACLLSTWLIVPFQLALSPLPVEVPMPLVLLSALVNNLILLVPCLFLGLLLGGRLGLGLPIIEGALRGEPSLKRLKSILPISVGCGALGFALTVLLSLPFWDLTLSLLKIESALPPWKGLLASFYGGIVEESMFRLFLLSLFIWITTKIKRAEDGSPTKLGVWISIVVVGILFGLGHLGITSDLTAIEGSVVLRAVLLNGSLSLFLGWLYWRKGLESAIIAHFTADIFLHVLAPIVASLLL
ncbi:MAG: CPBP family intramembrane metalloprotease [Christensenellaceae bacterium]|nr:CPBP family intramembrane metalloprotease [Christensenellaceae bacterium]